MLKIIFTLDYEIHGNGDGCPLSLMVEPTERLLRLFDEYGGKLTIMADVAEILKFKEYKENSGNDGFYYDAIVNQLRSAVQRGHDVQLHLHSSYFRAKLDYGRWFQDWSEYDFAGLPYERMVVMIKTGKEFLEALLRDVHKNYRCIAFRAANWSVCPSENVVNALWENDILIDTSVFKGGQRKGMVTFDYTNAHHHMRPWLVKTDNICLSAPCGKLWEFPIYSEQRYLGSFFSINRLYRVVLGRFHRLSMPSVPKPKYESTARIDPSKLKSLFQKNAWKADFNQCSGRQLIKALLRAESQISPNESVPFVLIGHSKLFNFWNEFTLRSFLKFVYGKHNRFEFGTFINFLDQGEKINSNLLHP